MEIMYKPYGQNTPTLSHGLHSHMFRPWVLAIFRLGTGHLQVTKMYIKENYTEYDHSIGAYSKLSTGSRCRLDYAY